MIYMRNITITTAKSATYLENVGFVWLRTSQSGSHSISAALVPEGRRYRLIYSYRNQPKPGEPELQTHIGHCELLFEPDLQSAEGSYFNGGGRFTHGTMNLKRSVPDAA